MYYDNLSLDRVKLHLRDDQLLGLVKQRFKLYTDSFRIKDNVIEYYIRPNDSVMFDWYPHKNQTLSHFEEVARVYKMLESLESCMKEYEG